ncbi:MAG: hydrogenase maturation protease [Phycisphaerae bacterium]
MRSKDKISRPIELDTLVIGYGNPMRGDDGAGPALAEQLSERLQPWGCGRVKCISCMQLTPELAGDIAAARRVVFVDASLDIAPGHVAIRRVTPKSPASNFSHHLSPGAMLYLCRRALNAEPDAWVVAIGVESMQIGDVLSLLAAKAVDRLARRLAYRLVRPRKPATQAHPPAQQGRRTKRQSL